MNLGIKVKMLTGDAVAIGIELAKQLHLGTKIFDSEKLIGGSMSGADVRFLLYPYSELTYSPSILTGSRLRRGCWYVVDFLVRCGEDCL